jgi:hypothetical protein
MRATVLFMKMAEAGVFTSLSSYLYASIRAPGRSFGIYPMKSLNWGGAGPLARNVNIGNIGQLGVVNLKINAALDCVTNGFQTWKSDRSRSWLRRRRHWVSEP